MAASRREHAALRPPRLAALGEPLTIALALAGKRVTWLTDGGPRPRFLAGRAGRFPLLETLVPPVRIGQRPHQAAGRHRPRRHLVLHLAGHGRYREAGVVLEQWPGDVVVMDSTAPVEVTHPVGAQVIVLAMPAASTAVTSQPIRKLTDAPARLVTGEVETLIAAAPGLGAALQTGLVHQMAGLVDLALADSVLATGNPLAARRQEVLGWL